MHARIGRSGGYYGGGMNNGRGGTGVGQDSGPQQGVSRSSWRHYVRKARDIERLQCAFPREVRVLSIVNTTHLHSGAILHHDLVVYHSMPLMLHCFAFEWLLYNHCDRYLYWKNFLYAAFSFLDCSASFFFAADNSFVMAASPGASLSASSKSLMAWSSSFKPWLACPFR